MNHKSKQKAKTVQTSFEVNFRALNHIGVMVLKFETLCYSSLVTLGPM